MPPEASGREPELGQTPTAPDALLTGGFAPPAGATAPAPAQHHPQPAWHQPTWQQPGPQQAWAPASAEPDNGPAVLGFALALSSIGLLVVSAGLSTLISLGIGIVAITQAAKGKRLVRDGNTRAHKDLAQAGFVIGILATALAALATLFWIGIGIAIAVDESTRNEFERQLDDRRGAPAVVTTAVLAGIRLIGALVS
ncbi:MAG: hypothetical protein ACR2HC_09515 [Thermoleophilaceae bacterium]